MTDVETLLRVDAGRTPPGAIAFFMDDEDRGLRRTLTVLAVLAALGVGACVYAGVGLMPISLLVLATGLLAVGGIRTIPEDMDPTAKRRVLVVTASGIIVRDRQGLRNWSFEDLADVVAGVSERRPYLDIIDRRGIHHTFECLEPRRGERARKVIASRLRLRAPRLADSPPATQ